MHIEYTGHNIDLTDNLRTFSNEKFEKLARHFSKSIGRIHVIYSIENRDQKASATLHLEGRDFHVEKSATDLYQAIHDLVETLDRQLKQHKEKIGDRRSL